MSVECVIAADIGTTGVKVALIGRDGHVFASASRGYRTWAHGAEMEQDPEEWWSACVSAFSEIACASDLVPEALVLSGQMQDLIIVGSGPQPRAILYSDTRAAAEAQEIALTYGADRHAAEARNAQDAGGLAPKLLWMSRNAKMTLDSARWIFLGAHDYLAWRLCGASATDLTTASTTGLLLFDKNRWNDDLMASLGIRTDLFPEIVRADKVAGVLSHEAAHITGLPEGLPVIHGAGDAATATLGSGAGVPGRLSINLGTSGWVAMTSDGPPVDPALGAFNLRHPNGIDLIMIGAVTTAAGNYDWFRNALLAETSRDEAFSVLNREAESAAAGSSGLLFLPYLAGERMPFRAPRARGGFIGIGRETGRAELARAVLEGVAFSLLHAFRALGGSGAHAHEVTLVGGGAGSELWCRIIASVFECPVAVPEKPEDAGLRGAAILAGRALGWFSSWDPGPGFIRISKRYSPELEWSRTYRGLSGAFEDLHRILAPTWEALAKASESS